MIDPATSAPLSWYAAPWWTAIMGVGQLLAAIFAAWAAIVAKRAAKAAETSVEITKKTALAADIFSRHRDRAYVTLENNIGPGRYTVGMPMELYFQFKNVGMTPAYNVSCCTFFSIFESIPTEAFLDKQLSHLSIGVTLASSIVLFITCKGNQDGVVSLSQDQINSLQNDNSVAVASARIVYKDVFGDEHITRIAFQFNHSDMSFRLAKYYNSMT